MTEVNQRAAVRPTWEHRELPVLRAVVELCEQTPNPVALEAIADLTGFPLEDVRRSIRALDQSDDHYFVPDRDLTGICGVYMPSGQARRAAGNWPTPAALADRVMLALNEAGENAATEDERAKLLALARWFGGVGRELLGRDHETSAQSGGCVS